MKNKRKYSKKTKKEGFFTRLTNAVITICLTAGMLWGLQAYSGATSLKVCSG